MWFAQTVIAYVPGGIVITGALMACNHRVGVRLPVPPPIRVRSGNRSTSGWQSDSPGATPGGSTNRKRCITTAPRKGLREEAPLPRRRGDAGSAIGIPSTPNGLVV